jgi:hypothetical protein
MARRERPERENAVRIRERQHGAPRTYDETAPSFLVTEDGSHLVVLGEQYHYIFDDVSP